MPTEPSMTVDEFVTKWRDSSLSESQGAQSHFHDLCAMLGFDTPSDPETYTFERAVYDAEGAYIGAADVWKKDCFGWEYKSPGKSLRDAYVQLRGYQEGLDSPPILVVCDMRTFEIHTTFDYAPARTIRITLKQLSENPTYYRNILRDLFEPSGSGRNHPLHPDRDQRYITETAAAKFGELADALQTDEPESASIVARFLNRIVFCFFAESIGLFRGDRGQPYRPLTISLDFLLKNQERSKKQLSELFRALSSEEITDWGPMAAPWVNGGLFDEAAPAETFHLTEDMVAILDEVSQLDWSRIDPAILGTLFERGLNPRRRRQRGMHYTDPDTIMLVVEPVVIRPLRREFEKLRESLPPTDGVAEPAPTYGATGVLALEDEPPPDSPLARVRAFHQRLASVRVLDPACGSGNFLYVTMRELAQLEQDLFDWATEDLHLTGLQRSIGPQNMLGIDSDQFAVELTRLSLWIGHLQWILQRARQRLSEPILGRADQIECRDAIVDSDQEGKPVPAQWPDAEFIVGNPPFAGSKRLRDHYKDDDDDYVDRLRLAWSRTIGGHSDLCAYWHEIARRQIEAGVSSRAGLLATNSITGSETRGVLERIVSSGQIFFAHRDEPWAGEDGAVRIAIVGQDAGIESDIRLDGEQVDHINPNLTTGIDVSLATPLEENESFSFHGTKRNGQFDITAEKAEQMLSEPINPNGRPNADVIFPFVNARDLAQRPRGQHVIDFGKSMSERAAALYDLPFQHVLENVKADRQSARTERLRSLWWIHEAWRPRMRAALAPLTRYIATPVTSKHRFFVWLAPDTVPDATVVVIAREDNYTFGVLHSRVHQVWALSQAPRLGVGNDPRYVHTQCFNTFPFPWPLDSAELDLTEEQRSHRTAISQAARALDDVRENWLRPKGVDPTLVADRTMTALYNRPFPARDTAHRDIDDAVFAAYGWSPNLSDDGILSKLLDLNRTRAGEES